MTGLQLETKSNSSFENFHDGSFSNALNKFYFRSIIEVDVFRFFGSYVENLLGHLVLVLADEGVVVKRVDVKSIFHKPRLLERAIEAATREAAGFSG